jgi:hypothetical protein
VGAVQRLVPSPSGSHVVAEEHALPEVALTVPLSPPPLSLTTTPLSVTVLPLSVTAPPLSVTTLPLSVTTIEESVIVVPLSVVDPLSAATEESLGDVSVPESSPGVVTIPESSSPVVAPLSSLLDAASLDGLVV